MLLLLLSCPVAGVFNGRCLPDSLSSAAIRRGLRVVIITRQWRSRPMNSEINLLSPPCVTNLSEKIWKKNRYPKYFLAKNWKFDSRFSMYLQFLPLERLIFRNEAFIYERRRRKKEESILKNNFYPRIYSRFKERGQESPKGSIQESLSLSTQYPLAEK